MRQSWIFFLRLFIFLKQLNVENVRLKKINMDRRTFIQELRVPVLATCAICLGSCAKDDITTPGGGNTGGNTTNSFNPHCVERPNLGLKKNIFAKFQTILG